MARCFGGDVRRPSASSGSGAEHMHQCVTRRRRNAGRNASDEAAPRYGYARRWAALKAWLAAVVAVGIRIPTTQRRIETEAGPGTASINEHGTARPTPRGRRPAKPNATARLDRLDPGRGGRGTVGEVGVRTDHVQGCVGLGLLADIAADRPDHGERRQHQKEHARWPELDHRGRTPSPDCGPDWVRKGRLCLCLPESCRKTECVCVCVCVWEGVRRPRRRHGGVAVVPTDVIFLRGHLHNRTT